MLYSFYPPDSLLCNALDGDAQRVRDDVRSDDTAHQRHEIAEADREPEPKQQQRQGQVETLRTDRRRASAPNPANKRCSSSAAGCAAFPRSSL